MINSMQKSIDQIDALLDGFTTGRLVIEGLSVALQTDDGTLLPVPAGATVQVRNGDQWQELLPEDMARVTTEGWPAYAGLVSRMKF